MRAASDSPSFSSPLFRDMTREEICRVEPLFRRMKFDKGEILFSQGDAAKRFLIVDSGEVKLSRMAYSGKEQVVEVVKPGGICDSNPGRADWQEVTNAEAATECSVWSISSHDFSRLVRGNPKVLLNLSQMLAERIERWTSLIEDVSLNDARQKLVRFLLDLAKDSNVVALPASREEVAQRIGSARETVARQLHKLKRDGIIALDGRRVTIKNRAALEKILE